MTATPAEPAPTKVAGYFSQLVTDNQVVKAGDLLFRIDPRDYQAAVKQGEGDVASGEANDRNCGFSGRP